MYTSDYPIIVTVIPTSLNNVTFEAAAASAARIDMAGVIQSARGEIRRNRRSGTMATNQTLVKEITESLKTIGLATGRYADRADDLSAAFRAVSRGQTHHGLTPTDMPEYELW